MNGVYLTPGELDALGAGVLQAGCGCAGNCQCKPEPGEECPACKRRVPHPPKPSSPKSRTRSYRVPQDEEAAHEDVLVQAAKHLGVFERPFWQFWTHTYALALVLQDESLRGVGGKSG